MVTAVALKIVFDDPVLGPVYNNGYISVDFARHDIRVFNPDDEWVPVVLTPTEFRLLVAFLRHPGMVLSVQHLADLVWPDEDARGENIRWHLNRLRAKIGPGVVENVRSFGYRYVRRSQPGNEAQ